MKRFLSFNFWFKKLPVKIQKLTQLVATEMGYQIKVLVQNVIIILIVAVMLGIILAKIF